jgi:putative sterol carrier protein
MSVYEDIPQCLKNIEARYNDNEKVRKKLAKYNDPIQMSFIDTGRKVLLLVNGDQGIEIKDNAGDDNAPVKIAFTTEQIMLDMFNKTIGAVKAYSSGKIKVVEGEIRNLMKLRSLLF